MAPLREYRGSLLQMPPITAIITASFVFALVSGWIGIGSAQEGKGCASFQACLAEAHIKRWTQLAQIIEESATNLASIRLELDQARVAKDAARVARLEALLERARADWETKRELAEVLRGADYRGYLLARETPSER